jgi:hypothetical protein
MAGRFGEKTLEEKKEWLKDARRLYRMTKPRGHKIREYIEDPDDNWFIYVIEYKKKTGEWSDSSMIIQKDMCHRVDFDGRLGWTIEKIEE